MRALLAKFLVPHSGNNHFPHSIRPNTILFYIFVILATQLVYNYATTGEIKVLSYATNIQQSEIITLTNIQRQNAGVGVVAENAKLDRAAQLKAADMFANDYWAHISPTGVTPWYWFDQVGYVYTYAGENLARDFDTSQGVIDGWMGSPSHRENMLSPYYTDIGVAVVNGELLGHDTTLVVQLFGKPQFVAIPAPQPSIVSHVVTTASAAATPVITNPYVATPKAETDISFQPDVLALSNLSPGQKLLLLILVPILAFFVFDAVMLIRRKQVVVRGHSLVHGTIVAILIVVVMISSLGIVR